MAFEVGAITAQLELDRKPFQASLRAAREEAKRFSEENITPDVHLADSVAKAQIDEMRAKLARLNRERVNIKVDVDKSALSRIEGLFGGAGRGVGGIPLVGGLLSLPFKAIEGLAGALDKLPGTFEKVSAFATQAFQTVAGTINDLRSGATTAGEVLGSMASGLVSIVASGGTALIAFGALAVVFATVGSAVISLVAALAALAASLAAAAAGAAALFVGAFAAAIPVLGVLIAFFVRLAAVVKAHQAAQQAATQALQQHKAALQAQQQAVLNLTNAQDNLKQQTVAAFAAMKQSAVDYQHALLGVEASKLGIEGARLSLRQAKQDLRDFLHQAAGTDSSKLFQAFTNVDFNPESARNIFKGATGKAPSDPLQLQEKLFAVKQAALGVKQANQGYNDSLNTLSQAEAKHTAFLQQGIAAYGPYENAVKQVAQAQDRLQAATTKASSAQIAYHQKLRELSGTEVGFLGTLQKILKTFGDISKAVAAPIFQGIERGFGSIQKLVSDPGIQRGLVGIGKAIGDVIAKFAKTLDTKPWRAAITQFITAGATLTRQGGKLFTGIATVLRDIAQAAIPHVINGVKSLAGWFTELGKRPGAIKNAVNFLVGQFKIWLGVAKALGSLIVAFLKDAAGSGGRLATHITSILNHWTKWLNSHPGAVKKFFDDAVASTQKLLDNLGGIVQALKTIASVINAPGKVGEAAGKLFFGAGQDRVQRGDSVVTNALKAVENPSANLISRINAGLAVLQLDIDKGIRSRIEKDLRALGYSGSFNTPSISRLPRAPNRPSVHGHTASAGGVTVHQHITTTDPDPRHYAAKLAGETGRAMDREAKKRGK